MARTLKQKIVVVNQYTIKQKGGKGSRGATPGDYVLRYMARQGATETLAPIRLKAFDDFVLRYMVRDQAVERASSIPELKDDFRKAQRYGGVAFGYGQVSLSDEELMAGSRDIQRQFDAGKTIFKTVVSFDHDYLLERGLIDEDFELKAPGDYRGHVDQMKLRMAVMHGLRRMGHAYDDLRYIGVIQVDTEHVHCHLAMVDAGRGNITLDGTQKGKISRRSINIFRRGVDASLDQHQMVAHMSAATGYERRNVVSYVKRWAAKTLTKESLPQILIACLPEKRSLWRAGSNALTMRKANNIMRELVLEVLDDPASPMSSAMRVVHAYARDRWEREGLSNDERNHLVEVGRERIIENAMNGVYTMLKAMPEEAFTVRTPMLEIMGMDEEESTFDIRRGEDDLVDFGYRLRSYTSRLDTHRKERHKYDDLSKQWKTAREVGAASDESIALIRFYEVEAQYNAMCAAKYYFFLGMVPQDEMWYEDWRVIADYHASMTKMRMMAEDKSLAKMHDRDEAEELGLSIYGHHGAGLLVHGPQGKDVLRARADSMAESYEKQVEDLRERLIASGFGLNVELDEDGTPNPDVYSTTEFPFEDVRGLDMHHLQYDFIDDAPLDRRVLADYIEWARKREETLNGALAYLVVTDQTHLVETLPVRDVMRQVKLADELEEIAASPGELVLPSRLKIEIEKRRLDEARARMQAPRLDYPMSEQIESRIESQTARISRELFAGMESVVENKVESSPAQ